MMDGISSALGGLGSASVLRFDASARTERNGAVESSATAPSGKAELSALAVAAHDAGAAPVDSARVERIRAAIADGSYQVDHQAIADKMIALDLGWASEV